MKNKKDFWITFITMTVGFFIIFTIFDVPRSCVRDFNGTKGKVWTSTNKQ